MQPTWWRQRLDPDQRLGLRLTLAAAAVIILAVPFTLLALLIEAAWNPLREVDEGTAGRLHRYALAHPAWVRLLDDWTRVFQPWTFRVLVLLLAAWLVYRGAPRLAAWAVTTIVTGGILGVVLKDVVGRARPHLPDPVSHAPGASFPSGHALTATLGCGVLLLALLPVLGRRAYAWAAAGSAVIVAVTAYTRVALGVHWLSDVVGGIVLGVAVLMATTAAFETWRRRDKGRPPASPVREGVEPEAAEVEHMRRNAPR